ncbi:hypothetical protein Glove_212g244 [Diversispora epigaea]|uniref:Protein kinase domain-containing protein n=1 Tax=Diversispora epigaea TaxID=1348612 RepID=A0A397IRV0_9GLOM|nr:hypothetical protein Glove_212g244 [Diversispora epigaea]
MQSKKYNGYWCKPCILKMILINGQAETPQYSRCSDGCFNVIKCIPYDKFQDIKQIAKGGYGTIYCAKWDGSIGDWDIENQQRKRYKQVVFNDVVDINEDF